MSERLRISQHTGEEVRPRPRVVLLGDPGTAEFSDVFKVLNAVVPAAAELSAIRDMSELAELSRRQEFPDFIVVVQTWSDEFRFEDVLQLPGFGLLTRVLCCFGPWCVSDGRSRQDWPLALRVPVEHFETALRSEWQQLTAPQQAEPPLPWTAGRDEIFLQRQSDIAPQSPASARCTIQIVSPDRKLAEAWSELVREAGFSISPAETLGQVALWDVDPFNPDLFQRWSEIQQQSPTTKIIALLGFSTPDVVSTLRDHGAAAVVSKLLPLAALLDVIQQRARLGSTSS
ncbi:MAG: hypothetical protein V4719_16600 [Planctomycetota bacterium]